MVFGGTMANAIFAQRSPMAYRTLTVLEGLPQSYVGGIVQDEQNFMWISTRDGLARYDGRQFKLFRHDRVDSTTLAANIINRLDVGLDGQLWISYESGGLDVMDPRTEEITHLSEIPSFALLKGNLKPGSPIVQDSLGRHWILSKRGELFIVDLNEQQLTRHTAASLFPAFGENHITGLAQAGANILIMLDRSMVYVNSRLQACEHILFRFENPHLYDPDLDWKNTSPVIRSNGDLLFPDYRRLIFYDKKKDRFEVFPLPDSRPYILPGPLLDAGGNIVIAYDNCTYLFDLSNRLTLVNEDTRKGQYVKTALCLDRSGVLWEGSNGFGIKQFDIYFKHMPSQHYAANFPHEVLRNLGIAPREIEKTFVHRINPYFFRWASGENGSIWMAKAGADTVQTPNLLHYRSGVLRQERFTYVNRSPHPNQGIDALTLNPSGDLWGIDHQFRLIQFDTVEHKATVYPPIKHGYPGDQFTEINGMASDDGHTFWISNTLGLIRYDRQTGIVTRFIHETPSIHLLTLCQDPAEPHILWLGTYSDGLVRFDKRTGEHRFFKARDGLPNNTVYAILPGSDGLLWCSSNKGIFSFHTHTYQAHSYIPQGIIPLVECNRFHHFAFPDGRIAFGGTGVYTRFAPEDMRVDDFEPNTVLTGIFINNEPADYGDSLLPLEQPINTLQTLRVPYYQNFLSFEFAALQFNAPEKLQYRYKLEGLDDDWVVVGNKNMATYTGIPPGRYTLRINASNTSGKWSSHVKEIAVIITPPFWKTWWFIALASLATCALVFLLIYWRLRAIRKKDQERMAFERETMELEARALRSQMNPHFIFNCLNSIKSLIQQGEKDVAATYLTIFAKLIRNQLSNTQKEIGLQEELDTCMLYVRMEALRFGDRLTCDFVIDPGANLTMFRVPPLVIQPFVENAIIHGILPKEGEGRITVSVQQQDTRLVCTIDDDGIGRERSAQLKQRRRKRHESKGALLVEHRLKLHNTLNRHNIDVYIHDKVDNAGMPVGTTVSLTINLPL